MLRISILFLVVFVLTNCHQDKFVVDDEGGFLLKIPVGFPAPKIPQDNILTKERIRLGKLLFTILFCQRTVPKVAPPAILLQIHSRIRLPSV